METDGEINFFHSIRDGQRHVTSGLEKSLPLKDACTATEVRCPLRTPIVEADRFTGVIECGTDHRRVRKSFEEFRNTREVVRVERVRVIVEARDKLKLRRLD